MFEKARGQFAVSLWDRNNRTLVLCRDRVGICPLYYTEADGWLLWASEIKALLASGMVTARPDHRGIDHLFSFFCAGTTRTFFEGIRSLPPGQFLQIRDGKINQKVYWDLDFPDEGDERRADNPSELIDEFEDLLRQSVERRLRGDVPVVSYISGGLDSTVVLGLSSRQRGHAVPSFTVGLDNAGPDERGPAAESAELLKSPLTVVTMDRGRIANAFPELIVAAEGPVLDTSCATLMRLAGAVHDQGYKVALTGEGADEALAGYIWFKSQKIRESIQRKAPFLLPMMRSLGMALVGGGIERRPALRAVRGFRPAQQDLYEYLMQTRPVLFSDGLNETLRDHDPFTDLDLTNDRMSRWHPLNKSLYVGYKVMLAGLLMISKGDRISMHNSIETRYPFLDDDVIRFCSQIAPEYKLKGMNEKWILRQVAAKTLPKQIANRPKTMFRASLSGTFLGDHRPAWVDQLLSPESLRKTGLFDPEAVAKQVWWQRTMPRITVRRGVYDLALTSVVSTQLWYHLFLGGGLCDLPTWTAPEYAGNRLPMRYKTREEEPAIASA